MKQLSNFEWSLHSITLLRDSNPSRELTTAEIERNHYKTDVFLRRKFFVERSLYNGTKEYPDMEEANKIMSEKLGVKFLAIRYIGPARTTEIKNGKMKLSHWEYECFYLPNGRGV